VSAFLLDTNVLSESSRKAPDPKVVQWLESANNRGLFTSVLALAEIRLGIELLDAGRRRLELEQWFEGMLLPSFQSRVLPVTREIANRWAVMSAGMQRRGRQVATIDGLIAATAVEGGRTIVTRDVADFTGLGASVLNPWEA
jgi:predicted nucleic acid-binding protein